MPSTSFLARDDTKTPILESQIIANAKIAIGGGINEPRDALLTILYGLLTNPDLEKRCEKVENKTSSARY